MTLMTIIFVVLILASPVMLYFALGIIINNRLFRIAFCVVGFFVALFTVPPEYVFYAIIAPYILALLVWYARRNHPQPPAATAAQTTRPHTRPPATQSPTAIPQHALRTASFFEQIRRRFGRQVWHGRSRVKFDYTNSRGEFASRTVAVKHVYKKNGLTYLSGIDLDKNELRSFRSDRISSDIINTDTGEVGDISTLFP